MALELKVTPHPPSLPAPQALIGTDSISNLHKLEQVSSDEGIGTLAENLLEALREHPDVNKKIDAARRETRAEKKRMAMAMRQKALGTLGMTVTGSSHLGWREARRPSGSAGPVALPPPPQPLLCSAWLARRTKRVKW